MALLITDATIIDCVADAPIERCSLLIDGTRIKAIGPRDKLRVPASVDVIEATGKYVIPGLMDANVHLFGAISLEFIARYTGRYEELILEAAQVALKSGITSVFDTCGPRKHLTAVRDQINSGKVPGSRIFCAGNIIGFDGPFSADFFGKVSDVASAALVNRINAIWVENVGRYLMWLPPDRVAEEIRAYIARGIDFLKYACNDHYPGSFLVFSPRVQATIVEEAHRAGITAQAHTMSVEGLRLAIEAGCDLIQHVNITGPEPIPEQTLELLAERKVGTVVFPFTQRRLEWFMEKADPMTRCVYSAMDLNARNLIRAGTSLLMAWDANIQPPEWTSDPLWGWASQGEDNPLVLGQGHLAWLKAMEEKGCRPMEMLRAATRNIAVAYGKEKDLGTLEPGKYADLLILNRNPLETWNNYRDIYKIIKDGAVIDRNSIPTNPILTKPAESPAEEEAFYRPFLSTKKGQAYPLCICC